MIDFQRTSGFRILIARLPNFTFTSQQLNLPGISTSPALYPNPHVKIKVPGDEVQFEPISVTYPLLEDFSNYIEIYRWMTGLGAPQNRKQFEKIRAEGESSEIKVLMLNSEDEVQMEFTFHGAFPTSLSAIPLDVSVMTQEPVQITATFDYTYFTINADIDNTN